MCRDVVEDSLPTISGGSSVDNVMLERAGSGEVERLVLTLEEGAVAGPLSDNAEAAAASSGAVAYVAVPDAAESDNETMGHDEADIPAPKFRKLSCSEPPPSVRVSTAVHLARRSRGKWSLCAHCLQVPCSLACLRCPCVPSWPPSLPHPATTHAGHQMCCHISAPPTPNLAICTP